MLLSVTHNRVSQNYSTRSKREKWSLPVPNCNINTTWLFVLENNFENFVGISRKVFGWRFAISLTFNVALVLFCVRCYIEILINVLFVLSSEFLTSGFGWTFVFYEYSSFKLIKLTLYFLCRNRDKKAFFSLIFSTYGTRNSELWSVGKTKRF